MTNLRSNLEIGKTIGQGHFGQVFLGNDPIHGPVAVKRMTKAPGEGADEWAERKEGLLAEGQHLRAATHRNVVKVHHLVEQDDGEAVLLVMELCGGGSLQNSYDAGPMGLGRLRRITTDITHGLQALHARGMIHRDIKPGNILVNNNGIGQIGDFGLVTDKLILGYGGAAGYLDHVAPEVFAGFGTSAKTDVWALGMTIYRLLHGSLWYSEAPPPKLLVPSGGFVDSLRWLPHIPKKWRRFVRSMLRDDPDDRLPTAAAVFAALSALPTEPDWLCAVASNEVLWERETTKRRHHVKWLRNGPKDHEWEAWTEPADGAGRRRTIGTSRGSTSRAKAESGLQAFFNEQT